MNALTGQAGLSTVSLMGVTYVAIADATDLSIATVGRVLRGSGDYVSDEARKLIIETATELGWDRPIPEPGTLRSWPTPKTGKRLTKKQKTAQSTALRSRTRAKERLLRYATDAGLTEEDLTEWIEENIGGPWSWKLIYVWSRSAQIAELIEAGEIEQHPLGPLTEYVRANLPNGYKIDIKPKYLLRCGRAGQGCEQVDAEGRTGWWHADGPTTAYCPPCRSIVDSEAAEAAKSKPPWKQEGAVCTRCRDAGLSVKKSKFTKTHPRQLYCDQHGVTAMTT